MRYCPPETRLDLLPPQAGPRAGAGEHFDEHLATKRAIDAAVASQGLRAPHHLPDAIAICQARSIGTSVRFTVRRRH
jgi:hypothetical protein